MAYADLNDVNTHLPTDKLRIDSANVELFSLDADRIIRGYVGGVLNIVQINAWADPQHTPEIIRAIAGRLIAAAYYAERYAENTNEVPAYAQKLYNDAIALLVAIKNGTEVIIDPDGSTVELNSAELDETYFFPNSSSFAPAFTRGQIFG